MDFQTYIVIVFAASAAIIGIGGCWPIGSNKGRVLIVLGLIFGVVLMFAGAFAYGRL